MTPRPARGRPRHGESRAVRAAPEVRDLRRLRRQAGNPARGLLLLRRPRRASCSRPASFSMQTTCPSCHGSGAIDAPALLRRATAAGFVPRRVTRKVDIPPGVDNGTQLRLHGEGEPSPGGGPPGDCYCVIHVAEHPLFQREGQHLVCQVPITYSQAALGAVIEVPTLDGCEELTIAAGTQPGEVFTLRGRGMPDPSASRPRRPARPGDDRGAEEAGPAPRGAPARVGRDREHPRLAQTEKLRGKDQGVFSDRNDVAIDSRRHPLMDEECTTNSRSASAPQDAPGEKSCESKQHDWRWAKDRVAASVAGGICWRNSAGQDLEGAKDRVLRSQAELENYRKRAAREIEEHRRYANLPLIHDLLPVLDNIERRSMPPRTTHDAASLLEGSRWSCRSSRRA